jgi:hypothetical protein
MLGRVRFRVPGVALPQPGLKAGVERVLAAGFVGLTYGASFQERAADGQQSTVMRI